MEKQIIIWIKKVVSVKIVFGLIVIVLSFLFIRNSVKLNIYKSQLEKIKEVNYAGKALRNITPKIDGAVIENIELKGKNGSMNLNAIFEEKAYIIIVYQNGIVCNPCIEYVSSKWNNKNGFDKDLSYKMIFISNIFDRAVLNYLENNKMGDSYFIDTYGIIKKNILKNDLPVNFILLVNKNRQIIYTSTFSVDSEENIDRFLEKANRYVKNRK